MQQAFVVLAGNRIFRLGQIERDGAVFHHHCGARAFEKFGEHLAERVWGHSVRIIHHASFCVSDRWTTKLFGFAPVAALAFRSWDNAPAETGLAPSLRMFLHP